eukprot:Skav235619  [mRNA]  locus=scaffold358:197664:202777:+ [translate_table: standard]
MTCFEEQSAIDKFLQGISDSTLGDRAKAVNTYREFVVYDKDQVYPEYLVLYERLHGTRPPEPPPKDMPYLLELPLYWKNVGKNPRMQEMSHDDFHDHWLVRPKIANLIYRLALHTSENTCPKARRRQSWECGMGPSVAVVRSCAAMAGSTREKGGRLRPLVQIHQLEEATEPTAIGVKDGKELDGNPDSGHVLTGELLAEHDGDEDDWSAGYCKESDGVKYVLLCRAVCGEMFYTEQQAHRDAPQRALEQGMQSVLANPDKAGRCGRSWAKMNHQLAAPQAGPREYILFETAQVYPEYIVEFVTRNTE